MPLDSVEDDKGKEEEKDKDKDKEEEEDLLGRVHNEPFDCSGSAAMSAEDSATQQRVRLLRLLDDAHGRPVVLHLYDGYVLARAAQERPARAPLVASIPR